MLLRCFRVDRIFRSINQYIIDTMDEFFIMPPAVSFTGIYEQTTCYIPVCFILSTGSDPTNDLMKLAEQVGGGLGNFCHISLGQGQEKVSNTNDGYFCCFCCCSIRIQFQFIGYDHFILQVLWTQFRVRKQTYRHANTYIHMFTFGLSTVCLFVRLFVYE